MVWGGSVGLSPADDKLIQVERILNLDPELRSSDLLININYLFDWI
jgi:thymidine phosphorylase